MRKKIVITSIVAVLITVIVIISVTRQNESEYVTADAELGQVIQSVDATGSVSSAEDIELNFRSTGKIQNIKVEVGQHVKSGQILATLDMGALNSKVADARAALLEARAYLEKVLAGAKPEDVHISEVTVGQKEQALEASMNNLNNLKQQQAVDLKNLKNSLLVSFNNQLIAAENALETIDNTLDYPDAQDTLGVLNSVSVQYAEESQQVAIDEIKDLRNVLSKITTNSTDNEILAAAAQTKNGLDKVRSCLSDVFDVLENTIISSKLSQTELEGLVADITTQQSNISTAKTNLQNAESSWTYKQAYYDDQITKAQDSVAAAANALELAKAQLNLKKAKPKNYEITSAKAKVAKAEANLSFALANISDMMILAPVSGTITEINFKPGEQTSLSAAVIKMIGESPLEIKVDIPESDIAKLKVGQTAQITLDSFGDEVVFSGSITFIDPAETIIQDVVYYQVKIQLNNPQKNIKPGMTANVTIYTAQKDNVIRVPLRAVKQKNEHKIVEVLNGKEIQTKTVTTGLRGDEYIEIISGIDEGEKVITFIKNNK